MQTPPVFWLPFLEAAAVASPVLVTPDDELGRLFWITLGVACGTLARSGSWWDEETGKFKFKIFWADFSIIGILIVGGMTLSMSLGVSKWIAALTTGTLAWLGEVFVRNWARKVIVQWLQSLTQKTGGTTP